MAPNSVDDTYLGCLNEMKSKVQKEYLPNEINKDKDFKEAWDMAEKAYMKTRTLEKEQAKAIYVYTLNEPKIYLDFNSAVRTQKSEYRTTFGYHALHFFLTSALQTLNAHKPVEKRCLTGFRRANSSFSQDVLNKEIRFGSFTSSSLGSYPKPEIFGDKSCFEIFTCLGAEITHYSKFKDGEREVLIPPYEIFKVTSIEKREDMKSLPCEVVYKVKSTCKYLSNLNCALFPK